MPIGTFSKRPRLQAVVGKAGAVDTVGQGGQAAELGVNTVKSMNDAKDAGAAAQPTAELLGPNSEIARKLKQLYDEVLTSEVPDRFTRLLAELEQAEGPRRED